MLNVHFFIRFTLKIEVEVKFILYLVLQINKCTYPVGTRTSNWCQKVVIIMAQYQKTWFWHPADVKLQIWYGHMMSRMCLENYYWQNCWKQISFGCKRYWLKNCFGVNERHQFDASSWSQFVVDSWCYKNFHLWLMVDGQMMSTFDIIFMSIQFVFKWVPYV